MEIRLGRPLFKNLKWQWEKFNNLLDNLYSIIKITLLHKYTQILYYPLLLFTKKVPVPLQDTPTSDEFNLRP